MTKKYTLMKENPDLFRKFQETVDRSEHLMVTINLCEDKIEFYLFDLERHGIEAVFKFNDYDEPTLESLNQMLDARAEAMKAQWLPEYRKLDEAETGGWSMDFSGKDYLRLYVGSTTSTLQCYKMDWTFDDLMSTARFISSSCNPSAEVLEHLLGV